MSCKLCKKFYKKYPLKIYNGRKSHKISDNVYSAPIACAFEDRSHLEEFSTENWNCETMNVLRELAEDFFTYRDDMKNGSIGIVPIPDDVIFQAGYIVMTWYKNRGRTAQAYVMNDESIPEKLDKKTAEAIIEYYDNNPNQIKKL